MPPELVTDLMGLRGDTSDNIPGVPGIGEKTATQLLQKFGSLEKVLASVEEISGAKRKENLTNHADDARMSKRAGDAPVRHRDRRRPRRGDGSGARPRRPARLHARVRAAGGVGAARRSAARGRRGARPQGRDRAGDRDGRGLPGRHRRRAAVAVAIDGDRWAAADGERTVVGSSTHDELAVALADTPIAAHDAEVARRWPPRPARRRRPRGSRARARPRHDGRRLPARAPAPHLRAGRARRRRRDRPRRGRRGQERGRGGRAAGARRGGRGGPRPGRGSAPRRRPRRRAAAADRGARPGDRCCARSSCR